jgi:hypothetical protein
MRRYARAALAVALLATASCESDLIDAITGDPDVSTMRLSVGGQTITINGSGAVTGGPITISSGSSVNVSASFFTPDGDPDPNVTQASFQLNVTSSGSVTFQRNSVNPFAGTLTASGGGSSQVSFALYDLEGQRNEFGPWPVTVVVN